MDFRYKLAKDTFKGKKVPPKTEGNNEAHVSADQRGSESYVGAPRKKEASLLSLDQDAVTPREQTTAAEPESQELSRRGLFGMLGDYAEKVVAQDKKRAEALQAKQRQIKKRKPAGAGGVSASGAVAREAQPAAAPPATAPRPGFFRRVWEKIKHPFGGAPAEAVGVGETAPGASAATPSSADAPPSPAPAMAQISGIDPAEALLEPEEEEEQEVSRRDLMRQGIQFFAKPAVEAVQEKIGKVNEVVDKITRRVPLLRPPGAITEREFLQVCTRCDKCIHACPKDAIKKAPKTFGLLVLGSPYIEPIKNPCVMCDGLPCISACPEGALLPVPGPADVRMGYAILDEKKCQAYGDVFCQQCIIDCPIPGAITQVDSKPVFHKRVCTGCGVCVNTCNTVNIPVAIKIKPQMVIESQIRKRELDKLQAEEEARKKAEKLRAAQAESPAETQEQAASARESEAEV